MSYCEPMYWDPPEPTAKEIFIEDYVLRFEENDDKVAEVKKDYPHLSDVAFWAMVDEIAAEEAEEVWNEMERERDEERAEICLFDLGYA